MKKVVPLLDYHTIEGKNFNYKQLSNDISSSLVVQLPLGSGGSKTFICNEENYNKFECKLIKNQKYSVSAYQRNNISYTILCMISKNQIELMVPARQILEITDRIEFVDSDYNIEISSKAKTKIIDYSNLICEKVQKMGYLGVLGIDYIYSNDELYFIEINPRFQGTTHKVDFLLQESSLPSIFYYNVLAFKNIHMPSTKNMKKSIFKK